MNRKSVPAAFRLSQTRSGLSLLEVIIATVVLSVSAVMLVRIIGSADRNAQKAERRIEGQIVCQNRLDEILAGIVELRSADAQPDLYYSDWHCSVKTSPWNPSPDLNVAGLLLVEIDAYYLPETDQQNQQESFEFESKRPDYSLRRLIREPVEETLDDTAPNAFSVDRGEAE